jgi:hypothetical protein
VGYVKPGTSMLFFYVCLFVQTWDAKLFLFSDVQTWDVKVYYVGTWDETWDVNVICYL